MEDDKSTTTDAVDTSTEDEVSPEDALENDDTSFLDEMDDDQDDESEEEGTDPADQDSEDDDDDSEDESDTEDSTETEEEEQPKEESKLEDQKARNREAAERRLQEKALREQAIGQSQDKYVDEAEDDRDRALRVLQVDAYNNKVTRNTDTLTTQYEKAVKDFEVFNTDNPAIQRRLDRALDAFQAEHVKIDDYGNPIDVSANLYEFLQAEADNISELTGISLKRQADSKSREKSKASIVPSRAPKEPKKDPLSDGFDEEANRW